MWLPEGAGWVGRFRYVELARASKSGSGVFRVMDNGKPLLVRVETLEEWRWKNRNVGLFTSVFQYDGTDLSAARSMGNFYFDLDDKEHPDRVLAETRRLVEYLLTYVPQEALRIYFTGEKGFHVEIEAMALGMDPFDNLFEILRRAVRALATRLELVTVDFKVYDARRMWRLPDSRHQRSGLFKVHLTPDELALDFDDIAELARFPRFFEPPAQVMNVTANRWWRDQLEEHIFKPFIRFGTGVKAAFATGDSEMDEQMKLLRAAKEGERNDALNRAAFRLGRLASGGVLDVGEVEGTLMETAMAVGLSEAEARKTIVSGMNAGGHSPWQYHSNRS